MRYSQYIDLPLSSCLMHISTLTMLRMQCLADSSPALRWHARLADLHLQCALPNMMDYKLSGRAACQTWQYISRFLLVLEQSLQPAEVDPFVEAGCVQTSVRVGV